MKSEALLRSLSYHRVLRTCGAGLLAEPLARLGAHVAAHGRRMIGWDEILEGGVPADATVMSWRGIDGAVTATRVASAVQGDWLLVTLSAECLEQIGETVPILTD